MASFFISFLQDGITYSFGLLLPRISQHFQVGRAEAALTSSIMIFLIFALGPVVAVLVSRYGHRLVTMLGVAVSTSGLLLAALLLTGCEARPRRRQSQDGGSLDALLRRLETACKMLGCNYTL